MSCDKSNTDALYIQWPNTYTVVSNITKSAGDKVQVYMKLVLNAKRHRAFVIKHYYRNGSIKGVKNVFE